MYIIYALLGAVMASIGTIAAKIGLKGIDSNLLTALRGIIMAIIVTLAAFSFGKFSYTGMAALSSKQWTYIILSAVGGALSWVFFYYALSSGPAITVSVIDKLSIVFTAALAVLILSERVSFSEVVGLVFIALGTLLVAIPWTTITSLFK